jgi:hypothetical protein
MTWAQRLWVTLLIAAAAGGIAAAELDARHDVGAVILAALGTGAVAVAIAELVVRLLPRTSGRPRRVLLRMLAVLLPPGIALSIILSSIVPVAMVVVFGAMAIPIMWNRK